MQGRGAPLRFARRGDAVRGNARPCAMSGLRLPEWPHASGGSMKRFLLMAGLALPALPACVHANDFHRVLTDTQVELRRAETLSGASRSTASDALLQRFVALEDAVKGDPVLLEKTQRLHAMARFQLVHGGRIGTLDLPPPVPTFRQPGTVGESCEAPLPLNTGEALELQMQPGESLWIRVQGSSEKAIGVTTRGSRLDTRLSAWPDCRELVAEPIASADDSIGLQAELTLPSDKQTFWLVRLDNLSAQPGPVVLGGVDFSLVQGAVTRSIDGLPVAESRVALFRVKNEQYFFEGNAQVDGQGRYLIGYQQNGAYVLRTGTDSTNDRVSNEAWIDVPCADRSEYLIYSCTFESQQPTPLSLNGGTATVNFELDALGALTGVVRDAATGAPVANAHVRLESNPSVFIYAGTNSDALGRYRLSLPNGLASHVIASAPGYRSQLFNGIDCPIQGCDLTAGTSVRNEPASPLQRADFALTRAPRLQVNVRIGGQPAPETEYFTLTIFDITGAATMSRSFYGTRGGIDDIAPGSYRVRIESRLAYSQLHNGIECSSSCMNELIQATPINFPTWGHGVDLNFDMRARPTLRGTVRSEISGYPVTDALVGLYDVSGGLVYNTMTNGGNFELQGIHPGSYLVLTSSPNHISEVFDSVPCPASSPVLSCLGATPLVFTRESGDREIDIDLAPNPIVSGQVTVVAPEYSFDLNLRTLASNGQVLQTVWLQLNADGSYSTQLFPPDTVRLGISSQYLWNQIFPGLDCGAGWIGDCDLSNAAVFDLRAGQTYVDVDFRLRPRWARGFRVVRAADNAPLAGIGIDVWNSSGVRLQSLVSANDGMVYVGHNQFETRLLSTFNLAGLEDQVYSGIRCPAGPVYFGQCSLQGATPVPSPVNGSTLAPDIVIRMSDGIILFNHGFEN